MAAGLAADGVREFRAAEGVREFLAAEGVREDGAREDWTRDDGVSEVVIRSTVGSAWWATSRSCCWSACLEGETEGRDDSIRSETVLSVSRAFW